MSFSNSLGSGEQVTGLGLGDGLLIVAASSSSSGVEDGEDGGGLMKPRNSDHIRNNSVSIIRSSSAHLAHPDDSK